MENELLAYSPLTSRIGFLSASLDKVADEYEAWASGVLRSYGSVLTRTAVSVDTISFPRILEPLTVPVPVRFLFVRARNGWTAYFDNSRLGPDASPPKVLAERLGCKGIVAAAIPHTMPAKILRTSRGRYGQTRFSYYGFDDGLRRTVEVTNDGGKWDFDVIGTPLPFERTEAYSARRVQDRFNPELLGEYMAHYGIDYFRLSFYFPGEAILFTREGGTITNLKAFTLEEVQARFQ